MSQSHHKEIIAHLDGFFIYTHFIFVWINIKWICKKTIYKVGT